MADNNYQVVFTGEFSEGLTRGETLARLTVLLRKQPAELRALFHGPGAVIIARTSLAMGQKYVTSLNQTGALCAIRERQPLAVKFTPAAAPPEPVAAAEAQAEPAKPELTAPKLKRPALRTVTPQPGPPDITMSPLLCANAGGVPGGMSTNRKDWATLSFADLTLLAAFKTTENPNEIKLLLFPRSSRRPLLIEGNTIAFAQFPGVADGKLLATLRKFLILIYRSNPRIALDHATALFMKGAPPPQFAKDPVILISDLHRAYVAASAPG